MATISDERLAEMLADVEMTINASSLAGGDAYDIYPIEFQRALTELQSLRSQAGVSEAVAWGVWLNDGRFMDIASSSKDDATEMGRVHYEDDQFHVRPLFARPAPIEITEEMVERLLLWVRDDVLPAYGVTHASRATDPEMVEGLRAALQGEPK